MEKLLETVLSINIWVAVKYIIHANFVKVGDMLIFPCSFRNAVLRICIHACNTVVYGNCNVIYPQFKAEMIFILSVLDVLLQTFARSNKNNETQLWAMVSSCLSLSFIFSLALHLYSERRVCHVIVGNFMFSYHACLVLPMHFTPLHTVKFFSNVNM